MNLVPKHIPFERRWEDIKDEVESNFLRFSGHPTDYLMRDEVMSALKVDTIFKLAIIKGTVTRRK